MAAVRASSSALFFQREPFTEALLLEATPLFGAHQAEAFGLGGLPIAPNVPMYAALEQAGLLRIYTARRVPVAGTGLIGYASLTISQSLHSAHLEIATEDLLYLMPEYRTEGEGLNFIEAIEADLWSEQVSAIVRYAPARGALGRLFEQLGYECKGAQYVKLREYV